MNMALKKGVNTGFCTGPHVVDLPYSLSDALNLGNNRGREPRDSSLSARKIIPIPLSSAIDFLSYPVAYNKTARHILPQKEV
jgi:hypothetical protein